jgi:dTMP kinase
MAGLFIALEGPDGGGKTLQANRLARALRGSGEDVVECRDPGATELGLQIRELLLRKNGAPRCRRAEALLFLAARAQLVDEIIRPALDAGKIVVCDRFALSTLVYQGDVGGLPIRDLLGLSNFASAGCGPDLILMLDVDPEVGRARTGGARDRLEADYADKMAAIRRAYLSYRWPEIRIIDANQDADAVAAAIWKVVNGDK